MLTIDSWQDPAPVCPDVVLDTNVALDWLVFREPAVQAVVHAIVSGSMRWLISPGMRAELLHMLSHRSLAHRAPDLGQATALLDAHATPVADPSARIRPAGPVCTDPDDQIFIDVALEYRARWLLTRDKALLRLNRKLSVRGVLVLRPVDWPAKMLPPA